MQYVFVIIILDTFTKKNSGMGGVQSVDEQPKFMVVSVFAVPGWPGKDFRVDTTQTIDQRIITYKEIILYMKKYPRFYMHIHSGFTDFGALHTVASVATEYARTVFTDYTMENPNINVHMNFEHYHLDIIPQLSLVFEAMRITPIFRRSCDPRAYRFTDEELQRRYANAKYARNIK